MMSTKAQAKAKAQARPTELTEQMTAHTALSGCVTHSRSLLRGVTLASAMACMVASTTAQADLLRLGAPSPMFNASVLPAPWWVEHNTLDYDSDYDIDGSAGFADFSLRLRQGFTESVRHPLSTRFDSWTFGSSATRFGENNTADSGAVNSVSFDFKRQLLPETSSGKLALALGWALIDAQSGARGAPLLSLEGTVEIGGRWSLYGQSAWLGDAGEIGAGWSGDTFEAGLSYNPSPDLSLRAGYRRSRIRLGESAGDIDAGESSGFIFGAGFRW